MEVNKENTRIFKIKIQKESGRESKERNHLTKSLSKTCNRKQEMLKALIQWQLYPRLPLSFYLLPQVVSIQTPGRPHS